MKLFIKKIFFTIKNIHLKHILNNKEKKIAKTLKISLSKEEKKKILKNNIYISKIMKNMYYDWEKCKYEYFISDAYY